MGQSPSPSPSSVAQALPPAALRRERALLRALLAACVEPAESLRETLAWRSLAFDPARLLEGLQALAGAEVDPAALAAAARQVAETTMLRVARTDDLPLPLPLPGTESRLSRGLLGEALGALGSDLFPTRRSARRSATETARELAYLGDGPLESQLLPSPLRTLAAALEGASPGAPEPCLLEEDGPLGRASFHPCTLLGADPFFHRKVGDAAELARFQARLREDPLDGAAVTVLREFFTHRLTVGLRDSARWVLGSRHPWFDWRRARELITESFERQGSGSFYTPQLHLYTYDPLLGDEELAALLAANEQELQRLARDLGAGLAPLGLEPDGQTLRELAAGALDYHHDYPDFDIEAQGTQQGATSLRFLARAGFGMLQSSLGGSRSARLNLNVEPWFEAMGVASSWLGALEPARRGAVFATLQRLLRRRPEDGGTRYRRPPMLLLSFHRRPQTQTLPGYLRALGFSLSDLRSPQPAKALSRHPELAERLVVFFTLVLRHWLDTDHALDLRPERLLRDFLLLGVWGYDSPCVRLQIHEPEEEAPAAEPEPAPLPLRVELSFLPRGRQVRRFRPEEARNDEAMLARKALARFGPSLEPSLLRSLANFLMVLEELSHGQRPADLGAVPFGRAALEVFRETGRTAIRGGLVSLSTGLEMVLDEGVDRAQRVLARAAELGGGPDREP